jgi:hypothetical protein
MEGGEREERYRKQIQQYNWAVVEKIGIRNERGVGGAINESVEIKKNAKKTKNGNYCNLPGVCSNEILL